MKKLTALLTVILAVGLSAGPSFANESQTAGQADMSSQSAFSKDKLVGLSVSNREDKVIGEIKDVNANSETGKINFVILAKGGVMGIGAERYAVPLEALMINSNEKKATLLVAEDKLESVPARAEGMSDKEYEGQLHKHYGIAPGWGEPKDASGQGSKDRKRMNTEEDDKL